MWPSEAPGQVLWLFCRVGCWLLSSSWGLPACIVQNLALKFHRTSTGEIHPCWKHFSKKVLRYSPLLPILILSLFISLFPAPKDKWREPAPLLWAFSLGVLRTRSLPKGSPKRLQAVFKLKRSWAKDFWQRKDEKYGWSKGTGRWLQWRGSG